MRCIILVSIDVLFVPTVRLFLQGLTLGVVWDLVEDPCQFDHLQVPVQVEGDEVTGMRRRGAVSHRGIGLVGARIAIVQRIQGVLRPGRSLHEQQPAQEQQRERESQAQY